MKYELNLIENYVLLLDEFYDLNKLEKKYVNNILQAIFDLRKLQEKRKYYEEE